MGARASGPNHANVPSASTGKGQPDVDPKPRQQHQLIQLTASSKPTKASQTELKLPPMAPQLTKNKSKYASDKIIAIAADFWNIKINSIRFEDQKELGVAMYLDMMVKDKSLQGIFKHHFDEKMKIETLALKFFNMGMGWLIRELSRNDQNMESIFRSLGDRHKTMGVRAEHFQIMLTSLQETLAYYFPLDYGVKEKYAIDYIFMLASKLMMGESSIVMPSDDMNYLESLSKCLSCPIGREYLFRFLQQRCCDEVVIYFINIKQFQQQTGSKGRFMVARNIVEVSIHEDSDMAVNLAFDTRQNMLRIMQKCEEQFRAKQVIEISDKIFDHVTDELQMLILQNHWRGFKSTIHHMSTNKVDEDVEHQQTLL